MEVSRVKVTRRKNRDDDEEMEVTKSLLARSYSKQSSSDDEPIEPLPGINTTLNVLYNYLGSFVAIMSNFKTTFTPAIHIGVFIAYLMQYGITFVPEFVMCVFDRAIRDISGDPFEKQLGDKRTSFLFKLCYLAIPRRLREMAIQAECKNIQAVVFELYFNNRNIYHNQWFESFPHTYNTEYQNLIFGLQDSLWPIYSKLSFGPEVEGTDGAPIDLDSETTIKAGVEYYKSRCVKEGKETTKEVFKLRGSIKEFLDFQLHRDGHESEVEGAYRQKHLNIDTPIGNYRYVVCVQRGVIGEYAMNVFSIIPINEEKPQNPKAQHFQDETKSSKWHEHKWPTINAIDYSTYIQQADSITTYTSDRHEEINLKVVSVDNKPRLQVDFLAVSSGGHEGVVPEVDGAYVLLDTK